MQPDYNIQKESYNIQKESVDPTIDVKAKIPDQEGIAVTSDPDSIQKESVDHLIDVKAKIQDPEGIYVTSNPDYNIQKESVDPTIDAKAWRVACACAALACAVPRASGSSALASLERALLPRLTRPPYQ